MPLVNRRASETPYRFCGSKTECAYCGDLANSIDHCTPAWFVAGNHELIKRYFLVKVASCKDCNVRAGQKVDRTFVQRRRRIAAGLRRANRKTLSIADWEIDDIKRLGRGLRNYVKRGQEIQRWLLLRLERLESPISPEGVPHFLLARTAHTSDVEEGVPECHDEILPYTSAHG